MKHTMRKFLALVMALMLALSAFAMAEEALDAPQTVEQPGEAAEPESPEGQSLEGPQEPQTEPTDGEADAGEDEIAIEAVDAVYEEQSADLVEEAPDLPADEAAELPVEEDVYSEDAAAVAEGYHVRIGDKNVTGDPISIGGGTAALEGNTLTLTNCKDIPEITVYGTGDEKGLIIELAGDNTIIAKSNNGAIFSEHPLTIKGSGTLTIQNTYDVEVGKGFATGIKAVNGGFNLAGGTVKISVINSTGDAYAVDTTAFSVTGGELILDVTKSKDGLSVNIPETVNIDLSKKDIFYGDSEAAAQRLSADATVEQKRKALGAKYVRIADKKEEAAPTTPTTPTVSMDRMFCRLVCEGKSGLTVKWSAMDGVDGYDVFMTRCGKGKYNLIYEAKAGEISYTKTGLGVGKCYKAYVAPYVLKNGEKVYLGNPKKAHAFTNNGNDKKTNPAGIRVKKKMTVKVGKRKALNAKILSKDKSKDLVNHVRKIRYFSSDPNVATVSKKGKVKGVGQGTCVIYVLANNGICKQVDITVKAAK